MDERPKRPVLRVSFNPARLTEAVRRQHRQATIDALLAEAKDG